VIIRTQFQARTKEIKSVKDANRWIRLIDVSTKKNDYGGNGEGDVGLPTRRALDRLRFEIYTRYIPLSGMDAHAIDDPTHDPGKWRRQALTLCTNPCFAFHSKSRIVEIRFFCIPDRESRGCARNGGPCETRSSETAGHLVSERLDHSAKEKPPVHLLRST
jgi:hypothetical protein